MNGLGPGPIIVTSASTPAWEPRCCYAGNATSSGCGSFLQTARGNLETLAASIGFGSRLY